MLAKTIILVPAALLGAIPIAASADTMNQTEVEPIRATSLTLQQARDVALKAHPGTLAAVTFGDEGGRAAYQAVVVGSDGKPWTALVDAGTGNVFAPALSSATEDHADGAKVEASDGDGETDDD
jgi:hypothetical protein